MVSNNHKLADRSNARSCSRGAARTAARSSRGNAASSLSSSRLTIAADAAATAVESSAVESSAVESSAGLDGAAVNTVGAAAEVSPVSTTTEAVAATAEAVGQGEVASGGDGRDVSTEELLRRYRARCSGSQQEQAQLATNLRDLLVERHRSLVEAMARSLAARLPPSVDAQDLVHAGIWGLMQAIASYDPARCDQFTAFLRIRVRGAMLDELRHMDFLPRLLRRQLRQREAAWTRLRAELQREPTDAELAADLGLSEQQLWRLHGAATQRSSGGEEQAIDLVVDEGIESPIELLSRQELLVMIRSQLQPIEWKVLQLHYLEGLTGKQVARRLRLSASRICQIHVRVLERLKAQLAAVASS